jgi:protein O-mannosyl-transferase
MRRPTTRSKPAPTRATEAAIARPHFLVWLMAMLLGLVTLALYWPATGFGFINYDDADFVTSNVHVQSGLNWEGLKWAFGLNEGDYWHPLTWLSLMLDASFFGQAAGGFHFTNVALHAVNGVLVFLLLRMLTGALWRSVVVAALFALHPLRVESVVWVTERKDVLSGCFGLLSLVCYARYVQGRGEEASSRKPEARDSCSAIRVPRSLSQLPYSIFYLLSLSFFTCGLMSKAMLVTWPFVLLLLDYWPLGRMQNEECRRQKAGDGGMPPATRHPQSQFLWRLVWEKAPFFVLSGILCVLTYLTERARRGAVGFETSPALLRLENAWVAYASYLDKTFWPVKLAVPYVNPAHWSWLELGGSVLIIVGVCWMALWVGQRRPYFLVGWCWFLGTMIPVIGLTRGWGSFMADRFTYVPSIGLLILVIWGVCELIRGRQHRVAVLSAAGGATIVLCLALTRQQIGYWKDSEALFRHAIEVTENNDRAYNCLGVALDQKGRLDEAIRQFQEAMRLEPTHPTAHYNLGIAFNKKGQADEAIRQFQEAIRLNPLYTEAHYNLGIVLSEKGRVEEAIGQFQEAIRLKPDYAEAHNDLGISLGRKGQMDQAIHQFEEAIRLKPRYAEAHYNLGLLLGLRGQSAEAKSQFEEALRWKPEYAEARKQLDAMLGSKR